MGQPSIQYNDNDPNSGRIATAIRLSQAGTQPNVGLLHSGVVPSSLAQPGQQNGPTNYVLQGPVASTSPAVPLNVNPNAAATSGPTSGGGVGNANQPLIAAMSVGDDGPDTAPYQQATALGSGIASNAAGVAGGPQTQLAIGATQLDNVQFTAAPSGTISSLTLNAAWPRATASNYILGLSNGQVIYGVTLSNGASTCTFASTVIQGSPNSFAAVAQ